MNKRKLLMLSLALCLAAILVTGGTLAFLTDTDAQKNTFTAGKVGLKLDEAVVLTEDPADPTSKYIGVSGERTSKDQTYKVFPGDVITKDPTITVDADSEDAYIAAVLTLKGDLTDLIGIPGEEGIQVTQLLSGAMLEGLSAPAKWEGVSELLFQSNAACHVYQDASKAAEDIWTVYLFVDAVQSADAVLPLFTTLTIPAQWDNAEMLAFHNTTIDVNAYAVQADGFDSCFAAMKAAHKTVFTLGE